MPVRAQPSFVASSLVVISRCRVTLRGRVPSWHRLLLLLLIGCGLAVSVPLRADECTSAAGAMSADADPTAVMDALIAQGWQSAGITPTSECDDASYVRRVYLDLVGRIPTVAERQAFLISSETDRRERLVDTLLASDEHAQHFAELFDAMLLGRGRARAVEGRMKHGWMEYLRESFQNNRPWNAMARDMVLARETDGTDVRAGWYLYEQRDDHQRIAESVAPHFFGIRIECAQCHDHPLASEIQQSHYWGLVAFFKRSKNVDTAAGPRVAESAVGGFDKFTDLTGDSYDAMLTFFESDVVPEERLPDDAEDNETRYVSLSESEPRVPKFSRREQFAEQILQDHPLLARAMVNRLWALLIGRGFVHPVDRMDSMHDVSHPELLDWLSDDFRNSGYDVRRLIRHIVRSRAYALASVGSDPQVQPEHFAAGLTKPLTAEAYLRSVTVVTTGEPQPMESELLELFRDAMPDVLPEEANTSLGAALMLSNNHAWNDFLTGDRASAIRAWAAESDPQRRVQQIVEAAYGRQPDPDELARGVAFLGTYDDQELATAQLVWAIVTSAEFCFR